MIDKIQKIAEMYQTQRSENIGFVQADFLKIETKKYHLKNGKTIIRDSIIKPCSKAAMIIPKTENNKFLMVIQPRVATKSGVTVEFPAGLINDNEDIVTGVKRELLEETGFQCKNPVILTEYYQDCSTCSATIALVMADECQKIAEQKLDDDEFITYIEISYDEILELAKNNYIVDGNTLLCIELLKNLKI